MTYSAWCIHCRDIRKSRLIHFQTIRERADFVNLDPLHRIPLETVDGIPCCRLPDNVPKVAWMTDETRRRGS